MKKELAEKLKRKYRSKITWDVAKYVEYIDRVKSARIESISNLIVEFNNLSTLSEEEEKHLDKIIKNLKNYLKLLNKINKELNDYLEYLGE